MNLQRLSFLVLIFTAFAAEKTVFASQPTADWSARFGTGYFLSNDADFDNGGNYSSQSFIISGSTKKAIDQELSAGDYDTQAIIGLNLSGRF